MSDEMTVVGVDGIRRSFGEHYDTVMEVEQDPTGAMWAIHKQVDRIEELEAKLAKAMKAAGAMAEAIQYEVYIYNASMAAELKRRNR